MDEWVGEFSNAVTSTANCSKEDIICIKKFASILVTLFYEFTNSEPVGSTKPKLSFDTKILSAQHRRASPATLLCQSQGFPTPVVR